jgi:hypothetical protein
MFLAFDMPTAAAFDATLHEVRGVFANVGWFSLFRSEPLIQRVQGIREPLVNSNLGMK